MGIHHGTRYVAVTPQDATQCHVFHADLKPTGTHSLGSSDDVFLPLPAEAEGYPVFDDEQTARLTVKRHIYSLTRHKVLELSHAIAANKLEIEELRLEAKTDVEAKIRLQQRQADNSQMNVELSCLCALRRRPVVTR